VADFSKNALKKVLHDSKAADFTKNALNFTINLRRLDTEKVEIE
jgi:hypothetical protein